MKRSNGLVLNKRHSNLLLLITEQQKLILNLELPQKKHHPMILLQKLSNSLKVKDCAIQIGFVIQKNGKQNISDIYQLLLKKFVQVQIKYEWGLPDNSFHLFYFLPLKQFFRETKLMVK